ncbi:UDP-3-O-(3-hydroxymyristoyl)glucosamine N-acyltransferase [Arachidicoccus ginsenosidimutans]|uniref:UDP-3-O-(3-hydroxymyristoyl)glucosamine N-acyltransferase n=1 Tax=Arachidicoccus sp. BS20 TaxID=1850526 RepID=UPI0007F0A897|nr:UDP-3-O-(3-hydroxymyristoyl)glucosamine N-acyltransferase [Arachidicoccus sp. BS20]ANI89540.1 UDP-3-O-(3-hydroxymyristoyl)glucosamine N-acyltransferase [Arachidicoccus sp. BS20]
MQFSAKQIAAFINAQIEGDENTIVTNFNNIEAAQQGDLSFLSNPKYEEFLYTSKASLVIVNKRLQLKQNVLATLLRVDDAYAAFATLLKIYQDLQTQGLNGIEEHSHIAASAKIDENVYVGSFAYVSDNVVIGKGSKIYPQVFIGANVKVGENTIIYAGAKIYKDCVIGSNVIIHAGAVIGADGFGFAPNADGTYQKIPQIGNVVIEDNVEIGANTTIDRATLNSTIVRKGVKIDNLVQIAHNAELGENTAIAAQAGVSGSTKIGKNVMIAGQAGIVGHIHIADQTIVTAQSGVAKSTSEKQIVSGSPAFEYTKNNRSNVVFKRLPELEKKILELEKLVKELSK